METGEQRKDCTHYEPIECCKGWWYSWNCWADCECCHQYAEPEEFPSNGQQEAEELKSIKEGGDGER